VAYDGIQKSVFSNFLKLISQKIREKKILILQHISKKIQKRSLKETFINKNAKKIAFKKKSKKIKSFLRRTQSTPWVLGQI
jgi:hypothetical protein